MKPAPSVNKKAIQWNVVSSQQWLGSTMNSVQSALVHSIVRLMKPAWSAIRPTCTTTIQWHVTMVRLTTTDGVQSARQTRYIVILMKPAPSVEHTAIQWNVVQKLKSLPIHPVQSALVTLVETVRLMKPARSAIRPTCTTTIQWHVKMVRLTTTAGVQSARSTQAIVSLVILMKPATSVDNTKIQWNVVQKVKSLPIHPVQSALVTLMDT